ncbi:MAG: tagaturonate epimerase family protein [Rhodopirellula sp. JB044]|uniref:tagaturonate epimerase family protein n=1 Tax=Rhodopirellula sp. JB044 TaxID=3342844 RepID=UPI00370A8C35
MLTIEKYSFGVGDRFAHQAAAQLRAFQKLAADGVDVTPVWNKSNREHTFVGSEPQSVYDAAKVAVDQLGWDKPWHVDADHIQLATVEPFLPCSDFFTIDVADSIGKAASDSEVEGFVDRHGELIGTLELAGLSSPLNVTKDDVRRVAKQYLLAVKEASEIYKHLESAKGKDGVIAEVSMDETDSPQTPPELLIILAALADEKVPVQTIAPKFTGRFNKGVDYVGDLTQFEREFNDDLAVIDHAVKAYGLPEVLKLSVHSGSDKFSLYPIIRESLKRTGAGVHLKTAGTTWLEELIGLAEAGGDGLELAKEIYVYALQHVEELSAPYASVIDVDPKALPDEATVKAYSGTEFASAIRHVQSNPMFNPSMRQLLHVSFKVAAKAGARYTDMLKANEDIVGKQVTENIYDRHLLPLFVG